MYNAFQTARTDYPQYNWFWLRKRSLASWEILKKHAINNKIRKEIKEDGFVYSYSPTAVIPDINIFNANDLWYYGGNDYYSKPGNFFSHENDAWHRWKFMWVNLYSYIAISVMLLGLFYGILISQYNFTIWNIFGLSFMLLQVCCLHWIQGATFRYFYSFKLDSRVTEKMNLITKIACKFVDDWACPVNIEPVNYYEIDRKLN
jgi:hypothetical protein